MQLLRYWLTGIRIYVAIGTVLVTLEAAWWASVQFGSTDVYALRMEELYAWLAVGCLAVTLLIGPAYKIIPQLPAKRMVGEARRMLGLAAAWFGGLHVAIAEFGLLKGTNPFHEAPTLVWGFVLGATALIILLAMVATSFDAALKRLGVWWFRLHRLVYAAGLLIILHAILIGAHAGHASIYLCLVAFAVGLAVLHAIARQRRKKS